MILIADGGSTKTSWCLVHQSGERSWFQTEGYNPYIVDGNYITHSLQRHLPPSLQRNEVKQVYYYGAGCMNDKSVIVERALAGIFNQAQISVAMDLLAAARALLGRQPGFAAILGTGTNTCLYDGEQMSLNIDSLGYIMGDEGSGCDIGKRLLGDYIRGYMPGDVRLRFFAKYKLTPDEVMSRVYTEPLANRFCAGFSPFVHELHNDTEYARRLAKDCFTGFFRNLVSRYPHYRDYTFNCTGSVGYAFRELLAEVAAEFGMTCGRIIQSPMDDLVAYHS
jgi:glucosamine kinase